jgi:RNA polymerase sigma-70 factor, ECF subfamily
VGSGLDLDGRRKTLALHLGDHAREPVPGAAGGCRLLGALAGQQAGDLGGGDEALSAGRPDDLDLSISLPATDRVDGDAEDLGGLSDAVGVGHVRRIELPGKQITPPGPLSSEMIAAQFLVEAPLSDEIVMPGTSAERAAHDFDRLFREEGPGVFRTIYAFSGGRRDVAEEATAEAFVRAIAHAGGIREPVGWIYRTAFRLARAELKREGRHPVPQREREVAPPEVAGVVDALRRLSPNQRAAIVLRYEADLPIDEVARRMGTAQATVRVHLFRGRKRLRELLGAEEDEDA